MYKNSEERMLEDGQANTEHEGKKFFFTIDMSNKACNFQSIRADVKVTFRYKKFNVTPNKVIHI